MLIGALTYLAICIAALAVAITLARRVFALPPHAGRIDTVALPPAGRGALAHSLAKQGADHRELTGITPLGRGGDAFAARFLLTNAAVSSIDLQYYIWRADMTGHMLLDALRRAADRGVRVRLLLDDNGIRGLDDVLAALDAHDNIEVRLYNPFNLRRFKLLSFGFDFFRLNRRMHNKSFTVDGRVSIVGGRNIGDEYFETGANPLQIDLDVLVVGAVVPEISADFDRYWAARPVHPARPLLGAPRDPDALATNLANYSAGARIREYRDLLASSDMVAALTRGTLDLEWTTALLVSDDPIKGEGALPREDLLTTRLSQAVGRIESRFDGVTPYFVPTAAGVKAFARLKDNGVSVRMLTNSLEATNMLPVHASYTKRRMAMLRAGVGLFEMRREGATTTPREAFGPMGSSGAHLHAKTFAVDGARIFVGSFNFDPRSTTLNTEMGLLIESSQMAEELHSAFDRGLGGLAWRVEIRDGGLVWIDAAEAGELEDEPGSTALRRLALTIIGRLPVDWLM